MNLINFSKFFKTMSDKKNSEEPVVAGNSNIVKLPPIQGARNKVAPETNLEVTEKDASLVNSS